MKSADQSTSLEGLRVALSGAVPDLEDLRMRGWSELDIRLTVTVLTERLLMEGADLVHGNHPTYLPLVERVARQIGDRRRRVTIVTSHWFFEDHGGEETGQTTDTFSRRHDYAQVIFTPNEMTIGESLTTMREALVDACDAMVVVGGRLHQDTGGPGVEEEVDIAVSALEGRAIYLLGTFGGAVSSLYDDKFRNHEYLLRNGLNHDENKRLVEAKDPSAATLLVLEGLRRLAPKLRR